jgi:hypothetical protein
MNPNNSSILSAPAGDTGPSGGGTQSGGTLADTKQKIAQTARDTASKVKTAASDTVAKAKGEAQRVVTEKKETAANRIGGYSSAIHDTARSIEEKDPNIAWFTHQAADKLQSVADYMRNSDLACVRGDCEGIARRNPALFFGGMFFAGLLVGNMLKASRRTYDENNGDGQLDYSGQAGMDTEWSENRDNALTPADLSAAERNAAGI